MRIIATNNGLTLETDGLSDQIGCEISATVGERTLTEECRNFIQFVADYVISGATIRSGETLRYGYWLTKGILDDRQRLIFFEYNLDATEFVFGVSHTMHFWKSQHEVCGRIHANFLPPRPDQMIVISDGVVEGDDVKGVRYPSPDHMSGWWMTTAKYDGDISSLKKVHAYHVTSKRADLAQFLALPHGYRFSSKDETTWFDQKVAAAKL